LVAAVSLDIGDYGGAEGGDNLRLRRDQELDVKFPFAGLIKRKLICM
jgi:hypothetical protein